MMDDETVEEILKGHEDDPEFQEQKRTHRDDSTNHEKVEHSAEQMHTDEFLGEIIGIGKLKEWTIAVDEERPRDSRVRARLVMDLPAALGGGYYEEKFVAYGKTMGFALREIRELVRNETGR
jgi:hypothetical protein